MAGGRPTKYKPEFVQIAGAMAKLGAIEPQIAQALGVSVASITLWKVKHPEFSAALKMDKDVADDQVAQSLFKRAMGYSVTEEEIKVVDGKIVRLEVTKHYPPDTTALIFWLKNRKPAEWRDKRENEITGTLNLANLTDEELDRAITRKLAGNEQAAED